MRILSTQRFLPKTYSAAPRRPGMATVVQHAGRRLHLEVSLVLRRCLRDCVEEPSLAQGKRYLGQASTLKSQGLTGQSHLQFLHQVRKETEIRLGFPAIATPYVEFDTLRDRLVTIIREIENYGFDFSRRLGRRKTPTRAVSVEQFSQKAFTTMPLDEIFLVTAQQIYNRLETILIRDLHAINLNSSASLQQRGVVGETLDNFYSHIFFHLGIVFPHKRANGKPTLKPQMRSFDLIPDIRNLLRDQVKTMRKTLAPTENIFLVRFPMTEGRGTFFIWVLSPLGTDAVQQAFEQLYRPDENFAFFLHQALEDAAPYGILRLSPRSAHEWGKFQVMQKPLALFRADGSRLL